MAATPPKNQLFPLPANLDLTKPGAIAVLNDRFRRISTTLTSVVEHTTVSGGGGPGPGPGVGALNVLDYGAAGDVVAIADAVMTASSPNVASASTPFTLGCVGKTICVAGAGAAGVGFKSTIITLTDSGHVVCAANATTAVTGAIAFWGTDDTTSIQAALDAAAGGELLFPDRVYLMDPFRDVTARLPAVSAVPYGLVVSSGTTLTFQGLATLRAMATTSPAYNILNLNNVANITLNGGVVRGERLVHLAAGGGSGNEFGFGIFMQTAANVIVNGTRMQDCWGDGCLVYGGSEIDATRQPSLNITFAAIHCDNNRRQGISISNAKGVTISGGLIENTNGTQPEHAIDVEPDTSLDFIEGVYISGLVTRANCGGGILLAPVNLCADPPMGAVARVGPLLFSVTIDGWTSEQDSCGNIAIEPDRPAGAFRGEAQAAFALANGWLEAMPNPLGGQVLISNVHIVEPGIDGVRVTNWSLYMPKTKFDTVLVTNPNRTATGPGAGPDFDVPDGGLPDMGWPSNFENNLASTCGFVVVHSVLTASIVPVAADPVYTAHIDFVNCTAEDTRATQIMALGFYIHASGSASLLIDATLKDCFTKVTAGQQSINFNAGVGVETFTNPPVDSLSGFLANPTPGHDTQASAASVFQLPNANDVVGREFQFTNPGTYTVQIRPTATDTIGPSGTYGVSGLEPGNDLAMFSAGDHLKLKSIGGNTWVVQAAHGTIAPRSYYPPLRHIGGSQLAGTPLTLIPTAGPGQGGTPGLWQIGDYIEDNLPQSGFTRGILCITGGSGSGDAGPNAVWEKVGPIQFDGNWLWKDPSIFQNTLQISQGWGAINADNFSLMIGAGGTGAIAATMSWGNAGGSVLAFGTAITGVFDPRFQFVDSGAFSVSAQISGTLTQTLGLDDTGNLSTLGALAVQNTVAKVYAGTGTPLGAISAFPGSIFQRTDGGAGSSLYVKESDMGGPTGWTAIGSTAGGPAGGDLTGSYPDPTVATVGGSTAALIHSAELAANAATSANTASTIVSRDPTGSIACGAIFAAAVNSSGLNTTGNVFLQTNGTSTIYQNDTATTAIPLAALGTDNILRIGTLAAPASNGHVIVQSTGVECVRFFPSGRTVFNNFTDDGTHQVQVTGSVSASGGFAGALTGNVTGNVSGSAATFTGNLTGDVTSVAMVTTVASVGGSTAANVHAAELLANAATSANTASAIVKRDSSGSIGCGAIFAAAVNSSGLNTTGNVFLQTNATSSIYAKDTAGSAIQLAALGSDNILRIGTLAAPASNGHVIIQSTGVEAVRIFPSGRTVFNNFTDDGTHQVQVTGSVSASGGFVGALTGNVTGNVSGSAATFTGNLTGDVTSVAMVTTVAAVGGSTAANVHAAELLANAATSANTASAIVKRDSSGSIGCGAVFCAAVNCSSVASSGVVAGSSFTASGSAGVTASGSIVQAVSTVTIASETGLSLTLTTAVVSGTTVVTNVVLNHTINSYPNVCSTPVTSTRGYTGGIRTT